MGIKMLLWYQYMHHARATLSRRKSFFKDDYSPCSSAIYWYSSHRHQTEWWRMHSITRRAINFTLWCLHPRKNYIISPKMEQHAILPRLLNYTLHLTILSYITERTIWPPQSPNLTWIQALFEALLVYSRLLHNIMWDSIKEMVHLDQRHAMLSLKYRPGLELWNVWHTFL